MEEINYNEEPVYYCANCLSLRIRGEIEGLEYCDECGCTNIAQCNILEWEKMFEDRNGHSYLVNYNN